MNKKASLETQKNSKIIVIWHWKNQIPDLLDLYHFKL